MASIGLIRLLDSVHLDDTRIREIEQIAFSGEKRFVALLGGAGLKLDSSLAVKARGLVEDAIPVLRAALAINPDEEAVIHWFNHGRLPFLSNVTPAEAVALGYRDALLLYVDSLDYGWAG